MNIHLENIKKLLQDTNVPEAEKQLLLKQLSDADKQWAITDFKLDRTEKVKRTTAILLEETIEELEQKRRAVEAQNRELEIETALERVRTVAMAMRKPADLLDICKIVYTELQSLGFVELRNAMINIHNDDKSSLLNYDYADKSGKTITDIPYNFHPLVQKQVMVTKNARDAFFEFSFTGEELKQFRELRKNNGEQDDPKLEITDALHYYFFSIGSGSIGISSYSAIPAEKLELLKRFRNVFNLSYQRYTDIALAETQARDAQIELALERVRARTMAMQKSEELAETAYVLLQQFNELGETPDQITIGIVNEKESVIEFWITLEGKQMDLMVKAGIDEPIVMHKIYKAWKQQKKSLVIDLTGQELTDYINYRNALSGVSTSNNNKDDRRVINTAFFSKGLITFSATEPQPIESIFLLERFAAVFDGTYTRFLDLQKAEASAREAQIELGLERVRARAMAMQHSDELAELVDTVFKELTKLDFALSWCMINIIDEPSMSNLVWGANPGIGKAPESYHMLFEDYRFHHEMFKGWKEKQAKWVFVLKETEKEIYDHYLFTQTEFRRVPGEIQKAMRATKQYVASFTFSNFGGLQTVGEEPLSEASMDILARFGKVFDLTYTRFNDLQKAEAQAKEARIETALERVRAAAMALKRSEDLSAVCKVIYSELIALGFTNIRNAQIAINIDLHQSYLIFEYSDFGMINMKKVEVADGNVSPLLQEIALEMAGSKNAFFQKQIGGKEFEQWRKWRVDTDGLNDPRVTIAHSMWFYLFGVESGLLGISTFDEISEEQVQILTRFKNVFELSYRRYADVAQAEAQAREAKIETALERVRSKSLAMHNTSELQEVIHTVHKEFLHLNIAINGGSFIAINDDIKTTLRCWGSGGTADTTEEVKLPLYEKPFCTNLIHRIKKGPGFFTEEYTQDEKKEFFTFLFNHEPWSKLDADHKKDTLSSPGGYTRSCCVSPHTSIFIINHFGEKFSSADNDILKRFGKVFEQTYTRFLDLQKAEAQTREAEIELALERVRARTMAMQHSDELAAASFLLDTQVRSLGIKTRGCAFNIYGENDSTEWFSSDTGTMPTYKTPRENVFLRYYEGGKKGEVMLIEDFAGKACEDHYNYLSTLPVMGDALKEMIRLGGSFPARQIDHVIYFKYGYLLFITLEPIPEAHDIFKRFAKVFEQTYTRFLDLQKAEAQAREAQIQLALERVRARTMAMQKSDELQDAANLLFLQVQALNIPVWSCGYNIWEKEETQCTGWMSSEGFIQPPFKIPLTENPTFIRFYESKKKGESFYAEEVSGAALAAHYQYMLTLPDFAPIAAKHVKAGFPLPSFQINNVANFAQGNLIFITAKPVPEAWEVFKRFAKVFEQTYTRFLDLQKAEAQAREAQIEAGLERVRSRSMAMHNSNDLQEVIRVLSDQLLALGLKFDTANFAKVHKDGSWDLYTSTPGQPFLAQIYVPYFNHRIFTEIKETDDRKESFFTSNYTLEEKNSFFKYIFENTAAKNIPEERKQNVLNRKGFSRSVFLLKNIWLSIVNYEGIPFTDDENTMMQRFANVFEQAYTRFLDLQKAEAQAREANIEAALEKVRSRSLAMHRTDELQEVVTVVLERMTDLNIELDTINIGIFKEDLKEAILWTAAPGQKYAVPFHLPFIDQPFHTDIFTAKENGLDFITKTYSYEEKNNYFNYTFEHTDFKNVPEPKKKLIMEGRACTRSIAITKNAGIIIIRYSEKPFSESENEILKRFAKVFEQAYTRFLDLQKAEAQAREGHIQLALERVRARTMAMQKSEELPEASNLLFHQVQSLGMPAWSAGYCIWDEDKQAITLWMSSEGVLQPSFKVPLTEDPSFIHMLEGSKNGESFFVEEIGGDALKRHYEYLRTIPGVRESLEEIEAAGFPVPTFQIFHLAYFSKGFLLFITYEPVPEAHDIFKRFAKVFDQTYTRFLDLQKAEAQAREAQIELALERVRARTMAMQHSEELKDAASLLFQQVSVLGVHSWTSGFQLWDKDQKAVTVWTCTEGVMVPPFNMPATDETAMIHILEAAKSGELLYVEEMGGEALENHYKYMASLPSTKAAFESIAAEGIELPAFQIFHAAYFSYGFLLFITRKPCPEAYDIFKRFAKVFDQTYTRFLDLQKAEAQAREAQIQLAMERVRARTMAMQRSDELADAASLLFKLISDFGIKIWSSAFQIWNADDISSTAWASAPDGSIQAPFRLPYDEDIYFKKIYEARQRGEDFFVMESSGKELEETYHYMFNLPGVKEYFDDAQELGFPIPTYQITHCVFFPNGYLMFITYVPCPEMWDIFKRFAKVFEQTYTRFLDLQKAEAQAREAEIELSLERVRSKAMAMHSSADILSTTATAFEELKKLGIHSLRCGIGLLSKNSMEAQVYASTTDSNGFFQTLVGARDMNEHASLYRQYQSWLKQENLVEVMSDEELKAYYNKLFFKSSAVSAIPQIFDNKQYGYYFSFADGLFYSWSDREYTENEINILTRFKTIVALTFRRFLDLEKAEAQAKEGQIQLALERVRAKTMAMQKSEELAEVATLLFKQVNELNIKTWTTGFNIWSDDDNAYEDWITNPQGGFVEPYTVDATTFSVFKEVSDAKKNGKEFLLQHLEGDLLKQTYEELSKFGDKKQFEKMLEAGGQFPLQQFDHFVFGSKVSLMFITYEPVPEAHDIFKRFGKVFEQTYTRFLDLQKAEAQAKESQIEAALEKVRSRTLAMQKSDELAETAAVLFQQLIALGIEPNRLYIAIVKDEKGASEFWITDEDGTKISTAFSADMNANVSFAKMFEGWKQQRKSLVIDMQGAELQHYFQHLTSLGVPFKNGLTNKRRVQDIAYFSKGFIGIASPDEQPPETLQLLERFAAVFNLTFTRFNDLKIAEAHAIQAEQDLIAIKEAKQKAEAAFTELQATQKQLIQSEKMASLGELTAGIAHEIQNPLNFVNNFSELSNELIDEMNVELDKGDINEAKAIALDVKQNLEKINHHGKRADAIVKGMLQHSRSSSSVKEPTDINALCDEYLRLGYHGLRAKDNSFNADFKTDFDDSIGLINIVPQDIGRVLLNLYNNAFYAVQQKQKASAQGLPTFEKLAALYEPTVSLKTKKIADKISISVIDNGNGIPQTIVNKIFQPFFTTKPTGQGTGLGLSLSYDIIKAHGGEIKVETKEGEGTAFIIQLPAN